MKKEKKDIIVNNRLVTRYYLNNDRSKFISKRKRLPKWFYEIYSRNLVRFYVENGFIKTVKLIKDTMNLTLREAVGFVRIFEGRDLINSINHERTI